jgi:predicted metal-binding protein
MDNLISSILKDARGLGITYALEVDLRMLVPKPWVRRFCYANKCGKYGKHYMCPPLIGSLKETDIRLRDFKQ